MKHKHAELIHSWAEGAEIEIKNEDGIWVLQNYPIFYPRDEYRVKPKEPNWWENIPKHGVLVRNNYDRSIAVIVPKDINIDPLDWTPLTNDEIKEFLR